MNAIALTNTDIKRAAFMVAKTNGNINPIVLGIKMAIVADLKRRFATGEVVTFEYLKKSTGRIRRATEPLTKYMATVRTGTLTATHSVVSLMKLWSVYCSQKWTVFKLIYDHNEYGP